MTHSSAHKPLVFFVRRLALLAVSLTAVMQSSSVNGAQNAPANEPFPRAARRAIAHGRATEAEALAKARPANDPAAVAVLARLAIARGAYDEAREDARAGGRGQSAERCGARTRACCISGSVTSIRRRGC